MKHTRVHNILFLAVGLMFSAVGVVAQQPDLTDKQKLILEFRKLTGADNVNMRIGVSVDDVKADLLNTVSNDAGLTPVQKQELQKSAMDAFERIDSALKTFLNDHSIITPISEAAVFQLYDTSFNEAELRELITFYGSPTGKKSLVFLRSLSTEAQKGFQAMLLPKVQEFITPKIKAEGEALKQKILEAKATK